MKYRTPLVALTAALLMAGPAAAMSHLMVEASDQDVSGGEVVASKVHIAEDGWLVIHRTGDDMAPGAIVGHTAVKQGENANVSTKLDEQVNSGDKLLFMLHADGGTAGEFEPSEDAPVMEDGKMITTVITAK